MENFDLIGCVIQAKNREIEKTFNGVIIGDGPKYAEGIKNALEAVDIIEVKYAKLFGKIQEKGRIDYYNLQSMLQKEVKKLNNEEFFRILIELQKLEENLQIMRLNGAA